MGGAVKSLVGGITSIFTGNQEKKAIDRARREQEAAAAAAQARLDPYQQQGEYATGLVREGLDTGTLGGSFTPPDFQNDPGYQFRLAEGEAAQDRLQAARGNLYSGQAIKERERFSQALASQEYQDAYNRWLQTQQNRQNLLQGQQQLGYGAASGGSNIDLGLGQQQANATLNKQAARTRQIQGATAGITDGLTGLGSSFGGGFGSSTTAY